MALPTPWPASTALLLLHPLPLPPARSPVYLSIRSRFHRYKPSRFSSIIATKLPQSMYLSPRCQASSPGRSEVGDEEDQVSRATLVWRAVKLPIYSVAVVPLSVGSAAAYLQTGHFQSGRYLLLLLSSVFIIAWLNLSNDVYDFDTGADKNKKESVVNLLGSRAVTHFAANISLALGFLGILWASGVTKDVRCLFLLTLAVFCGYVYQCPPFRLSYKGLGEPLCFMAFGPLATTAFYISQNSKRLGQLQVNCMILCASILVGLTTSLILFCSHFHQIEGDQTVGKMSPLVRLGTEKGSKVVKVGVGVIYLLLLSLGIFKALPWTAIFLCALTLPIGKMIVDYVEENHHDKTKIFMAKYYCVRLHTLFGASLAVGLVLARYMSKL